MRSKFESSPEPKRVRNLFTPEEDKKLIKLYNECKGDYAKIAELMMGRNERQCRDRYEKYLDPNLNKGEWTENEDDMLLDLVDEYGRKWTKIEKMFEGRSSTALKNRWNILERKRVKEEKKLRKMEMQKKLEKKNTKEPKTPFLFEDSMIQEIHNTIEENTINDFLDFVF